MVYKIIDDILIEMEKAKFLMIAGCEPYIEHDYAEKKASSNAGPNMSIDYNPEGNRIENFWRFGAAYQIAQSINQKTSGRKRFGARIRLANNNKELQIYGRLKDTRVIAGDKDLREAAERFWELFYNGTKTYIQSSITKELLYEALTKNDRKRLENFFDSRIPDEISQYIERAGNFEMKRRAEAQRVTFERYLSFTRESAHSSRARNF
jgi:hypothetical protein